MQDQWYLRLIEHTRWKYNATSDLLDSPIKIGKSTQTREKTSMLNLYYSQLSSLSIQSANKFEQANDRKAIRIIVAKMICIALPGLLG